MTGIRNLRRESGNRKTCNQRELVAGLETNNPASRNRRSSRSIIGLPETEGKQMTTLEKILKRLNRDIQPETVSVYTRHASDCPKRDDKDWKRCSCMKSLYVFQCGRDFRLSAKTRSWEKADKLRDEVEDAFDPVKIELRNLKDRQQSNRVPIAYAVEQYLSDARARNLRPSTLRRLKRIFLKGMQPWVEARGFQYLDEVTTPLLTQWRATWELAPLTARIRQERLKTFFGFCVRQGMLATNPALLLSRIIVKQKPTDYFTSEEFEKLVESTSLFGRGSRDGRSLVWSERLRVILLLMRWSGLRIGDAVTLERSRLVGDNIFLYQAKTGTPVYVPLPPNVAESLRNVPRARKTSPRYFFWSGVNREAAVSQWGKSFRKLFRLADIRNADGGSKRCHPHMFRDTFAVENLLAGIPIDQVSILLGHSSVKITEKHYAPFVLARQQQIVNAVTQAWPLQRASEAAMGG
jgi:integrase/recombinase XerD